jgi:hypothetical protein
MPGNLPDPRAASALHRAVNATLDDTLLSRLLKPPAAAPAPHSASPRHTAQQAAPRPAVKTNPASPADRRPLKAAQLSAARLLLDGKSISAVAAELEVHRYTISRWQSDPRFQAELRRQVERAALRNTAPQRATG